MGAQAATWPVFAQARHPVLPLLHGLIIAPRAVALFWTGLAALPLIPFTAQGQIGSPDHAPGLVSAPLIMSMLAQVGHGEGRQREPFVTECCRRALDDGEHGGLHH